MWPSKAHLGLGARDLWETGIECTEQFSPTANIYCLASAVSLSFHDCRCILITIFFPSISLLEPVEENLDSAQGLRIVYVGWRLSSFKAKS